MLSNILHALATVWRADTTHLVHRAATWSCLRCLLSSLWLLSISLSFNYNQFQSISSSCLRKKRKKRIENYFSFLHEMSIFKSIFPSGAVIDCITENHRKEKLSDLKRAMVPPLPAASRRRWRHGTVLDTAKHSTIQKWNTAQHTTGEWCSEVEIRCDEKAPEGESNLWLSAILFLLRFIRLTTVYLPRGTSDPQFRPFPSVYLSMYLVLVTLFRAVCLMQQCALDAADADAAMCSQAMLWYAMRGWVGRGGVVVWCGGWLAMPSFYYIQQLNLTTQY